MATLNPNLKQFWKTTKLDDGTPVTTRVLYGGRMSGKSWDAAGVAIARANYRTERFLCTRMFQNRISDSVYMSLKDRISAFKLSNQFKIYSDAIEHKFNGSLFRFYGIARNVDEIKSFEGASVWWNEESHNITKLMYDTIRPTIMRNDGAECWFTLNPQLVSDYSYKRLIKNPPKGSLVRQINYPENPFLTKSALDEIAAAFEEDIDEANHIYLGQPRSNDDKAIIKRNWVLAAVDAHKVLEFENPPAGILGYDVADDGEDLNATAAMDGRICVSIDSWKAGEDELDKSAQRAKNNAKQINASLIGYDSIGVGASTGTHLKNSKWPINKTFKFNAGEKVIDPDKKYLKTKVTNKEMFANLKAQSWWHVANMFKNTYNAVIKDYEIDVNDLIVLDKEQIGDKNLNNLIDELCAPRKEIDNNGRVKVESKKDLRKREIKSPNLADAFIIANSASMIKKRSFNEWM